MIDRWAHKGHKLGECYYSSSRSQTYVHVPKNASSYIKARLLQTKDWVYSEKFVHNDQYLVALRNPVDRWLSGMAQLIQSDPTGNWDEETIFNTITFDDHTEEQIYFLQHLDLDKCVFFLVNDTLSSKFIKWANTVYTDIVMHDTKLNTSTKAYGRVDIIKKLQAMIDNQPENLLKLKQHFAKDYELIESVKFYD